MFFTKSLDKNEYFIQPPVRGLFTFFKKYAKMRLIGAVFGVTMRAPRGYH